MEYFIFRESVANAQKSYRANKAYEVGSDKKRGQIDEYEAFGYSQSGLGEFLNDDEQEMPATVKYHIEPVQEARVKPTKKQTASTRRGKRVDG